MTLSELKERLGTLLDGCPDVRVVTLMRAGVERVVIDSEPPEGLGRYIRITPVGGVGSWEFELLWSVYGSPDRNDNWDGRCGGSGEFVVSAVRHWLVDRMRWQDVPEFKPPG